MAFTTWQALKDAALDNLAAMNVTLSSIGVKNRAKAYRDIEQLKELIDWYDKEIDKEAGTSSKARVTDVSLS
jgi:hypothetical protein